MKTYYTVISLFLLSLNATCQTHEVLWQKTIGGENHDDINAIISTEDNGYLLGGTSLSNISGDKTEDSYGGSDYWVIKLDSLGEIEWDKTIGGADNDFLSDIHIATDGGYILTGSSKSDISGYKSEDSRGDDDFWIVKLDIDGEFLWDITIGGDSSDACRSSSPTVDGGYIIAGYSDSNISGEKTENSYGLQDYWIVKIDVAGTIEWQKTIGGDNVDRLTDLETTIDGGYIINGRTESGISGNKTTEHRGIFDFWVVKMDNLGEIEWQKTLGGAGADQPLDIEVVSDGSFIVSGVSDSEIGIDKSEDPFGGFDIWVVKLDATGEIEWENTIGGTADDVVYMIKETSGGFILGGYSDSDPSADKSETAIGNTDYWILKLNESGEIEWENSVGSSSTDNCSEIIETADNNFIAAGKSYGSISGDKNETNLGGTDIWLVKLGECDLPYIDNTVLTGPDHLLEAADDGEGLFYQWYKCEDDTRILVEGATERIFDWDYESGYFAVEITDSVCWTVLSDCFYKSVNVGAIDADENKAQISFYPNPSSTDFHIDYDAPLFVEIISPTGAVLAQHYTNDISIANLSNGLYLIRIYDQNKELIQQTTFIKE